MLKTFGLFYDVTEELGGCPVTLDEIVRQCEYRRYGSLLKAEPIALRPAQRRHSGCVIAPGLGYCGVAAAFSVLSFPSRLYEILRPPVPVESKAGSVK